MRFCNDRNKKRNHVGAARAATLAHVDAASVQRRLGELDGKQQRARKLAMATRELTVRKEVAREKTLRKKATREEQENKLQEDTKKTCRNELVRLLCGKSSSS